MQTGINPSETVLPIFRTSHSLRPQEFLGTGFFLVRPSVFVTAYHVIKGCETQLVTVYNRARTIHSLQLLSHNENTDLALLKADFESGFRPPAFIELPPNDLIPLNRPIMCYEYSTTRQEVKDWPTNSTKLFILSPVNRTGNVLRVFDNSQIYGDAGIDMLELSFPALKGASGAPVITNPFYDMTLGYQLLGVIKSNAEYEPLPAQRIEVLENNNQLREETKYFLPQALAVNVGHVRSLITNFQDAAG